MISSISSFKALKILTTSPRRTSCCTSAILSNISFLFVLNILSFSWLLIFCSKTKFHNCPPRHGKGTKGVMLDCEVLCQEVTASNWWKLSVLMAVFVFILLFLVHICKFVLLECFYFCTLIFFLFVNFVCYLATSPNWVRPRSAVQFYNRSANRFS